MAGANRGGADFEGGAKSAADGGSVGSGGKLSVETVVAVMLLLVEAALLLLEVVVVVAQLLLVMVEALWELAWQLGVVAWE